MLKKYLEFTHIVLFIKHKIRMMSDEGKLYDTIFISKSKPVRIQCLQSF